MAVNAVVEGLALAPRWRGSLPLQLRLHRVQLCVAFQGALLALAFHIHAGRRDSELENLARYVSCPS